MPKVIVYLKPKFEEYDVEVYVYDVYGRLVDKRSIEHVKQLVIKAPEIRVSRQLFHEYTALLVDADKPRIDFKEGGLVYIYG
jgi:hypothetical protein